MVAIMIDYEEVVMVTRNRPVGRAIKEGTGPKTAPPKAEVSRKPPGANLPKDKPHSDKD